MLLDEIQKLLLIFTIRIVVRQTRLTALRAKPGLVSEPISPKCYPTNSTLFLL
jgi:hypothetical protein